MSEVAAESRPSAPPRLREVINPKLAVLFTVEAVRALAGYMLAPFLALYFHLVLRFSVAESGLLVGLAFLAGLVLGVVGGFLADRFGPVRALVVASVGSALVIAGLGLVPAHGLVTVAVLMAVWGVLRPVGRNTIDGLATKHAAPEHRGAVQNYLYWIANAGMLVGLLLGAEALGAGRSALPLFIVAAVYVALTIPIYVGFRDDMARKSPKEVPDGGLRASLKLVVHDRALLMAALSMLAAIVVEAQLSSTVPLDLAAHFRNGAQLFGPILAVDSVVVVAGQPLLARITARFKPTWVYLIGALLSAGGLAFAGLDGTVAAWFIGMVIYGVGEVMSATPFNQVLGELPVAGREVLYFSVIGMAQYGAMFLGPAVGPAMLGVDPAALWFSLLFVAVLGSWAFTDATTALKRRAAATQTVEVRAAGYAAPEEAAAPLAEVPTFQGVAAIRPIARISEVAMFGVPVNSTPIVFLESAAPEERERIWSYGTTETIAAGEVLVSAGSSERTLYLVEDGELEVLVGEAGRERRLTVLSVGAVFGEQAFVDGQPRSASIRATGPCVVRQLTWAGFETLSAEAPKLAELLLWDLARVVSERLRRTTQALTLLSA
jgi:CRP/FNR family cyclic AMP-dependent transcriptional regulator